MWPLLLDMTKEESLQSLRCLELEAYASLITALRAQGPLNQEKIRTLKESCALLNINQDRHKAEVRRVVNDEKLNTIAYHVSGQRTTSDEWAMEGRRLCPLMPRVAPQTAFLAIADEVADSTCKINKQLPSPSSTERKRAPVSVAQCVVPDQPNKTVFRVPEPPKVDEIKKRKLPVGVENSSLAQHLMGSPKISRIQQIYRQKTKARQKEQSLQLKQEQDQNQKTLQQFHQQYQQQKFPQRISLTSHAPSQIPAQTLSNSKINILQNISFPGPMSSELTLNDQNKNEPNCASQKLAEKTFAEKPMDETFADKGDKAFVDKPFVDKAYVDKTYVDKLHADKSYSEKSCVDKSYADKTDLDRPYLEKTFSDKNYLDMTYLDKTYVDKLLLEKNNFFVQPGSSGDHQVLKTDGHHLRTDPQHLRSASLHLKFDSQYLRSDLQHFKTDPQHLRTDIPHLRVETQHLSQHFRPANPHLRTDNQHLRTDTQHLRTDSQHLRTDSQHLKTDNLRTDPQFLRADGQFLKGEVQLLKTKPLLNNKLSQHITFKHVPSTSPGPSGELPKTLKVSSARKAITSKSVTTGQKLIVVSNPQSVTSPSILHRTLTIPFVKNLSMKNFDKFKIVNPTSSTIQLTPISSTASSGPTKHKVVTVRTNQAVKKVIPLSQLQVLNAKGNIKVVPIGGKIVTKSNPNSMNSPIFIVNTASTVAGLTKSTVSTPVIMSCKPEEAKCMKPVIMDNESTVCAVPMVGGVENSDLSRLSSSNVVSSRISFSNISPGVRCSSVVSSDIGSSNVDSSSVGSSNVVSLTVTSSNVASSNSTDFESQITQHTIQHHPGERDVSGVRYSRNVDGEEMIGKEMDVRKIVGGKVDEAMHLHEVHEEDIHGKVDETEMYNQIGSSVPNVLCLGNLRTNFLQSSEIKLLEVHSSEVECLAAESLVVDSVGSSGVESYLCQNDKTGNGEEEDKFRLGKQILINKDGSTHDRSPNDKVIVNNSIDSSEVIHDEVMQEKVIGDVDIQVEGIHGRVLQKKNVVHTSKIVNDEDVMSNDDNLYNEKMEVINKVEIHKNEVHTHGEIHIEENNEEFHTDKEMLNNEVHGNKSNGIMKTGIIEINEYEMSEDVEMITEELNTDEEMNIKELINNDIYINSDIEMDSYEEYKMIEENHSDEELNNHIDMNADDKKIKNDDEINADREIKCDDRIAQEYSKGRMTEKDDVIHGDDSTIYSLDSEQSIDEVLTSLEIQKPEDILNIVGVVNLKNEKCAVEIRKPDGNKLEATSETNYFKKLVNNITFENEIISEDFSCGNNIACKKDIASENYVSEKDACENDVCEKVACENDVCENDVYENDVCENDVCENDV